MPLGVPLSSVRSGVSFATSLAHFGDATALICRDGESLTYRKLAARVDEAAALLGTDERRLVLVAGANAVEPIVAYLAALAGGHPVLLAPGDRPEVLERMVETYDPDVVAAESSIAERREGTAHELDPELALLLSTSGSSGSPKLVRLSRENVESNAEAIGAYLQIRSTDRAATTLPMHYCYGLSVVNSHLARGAALVLSDLSVVDGCFWELFRRERATSFAGVPYTFELLERVGFAELDLPHLRYVTQAGGRMAPEQVARWAAHGRAHGWDLFVMYGQTEATARMAYLPPDLACAHPAAIGVPIPGGSFSIAPVDGTADDVGELIYSGPNVMLGYASSPADLALGRTIESLRTGDLARRGADGLYEIVGRRSRFVKVLGLRIDLDRTEALLGAACAGEDERLVVALEDERDPAAVRQRATQELGVPARAIRVVRVAELPRLPSGKPDHAAIAALGATTAEPRRDEPQRDLLPLFAELLDRPEATEQDTFASLGGDSLSYVAVSIELERALGHLPSSWHVTPIGELAAATRPRRAWGRAVETSVLLRALAIVCIVGTHAGLFSILGGAHLLVAVAGFNFARFQLGAAARLERLRSQLRTIARIAVPSVAWIALVVLVTDAYGVANVLLANAFVGPEPWTTESRFWFVEVLVWMLAACALLLAIPRVERVERAWPLGFALALFGVGLLGRYGLLDLGVPSTRPILWLFALGWAAASCTGRWQRAGVTLLALATVPGFFGDGQREAVIAGGIVLLLWAPAVRVPAWAGGAAAVLASASLYVYLVHWQVYPAIRDLPLVAVAASIAVGIAYWQVATWAWRTAGSLREVRIWRRFGTGVARPAEAGAR